MLFENREKLVPETTKGIVSKVVDRRRNRRKIW